VWTKWAEFWDGRVGTLKGHGTNHANDDAFQVEILGYSDGRYKPWVGDFTDENYQDLADFYRWAMAVYPIGSDVTPTPTGGWLYGSAASTRGTQKQYDSFSGLTAHGWVYGNSHWDTGRLNLERIHQLATKETTIEDVFKLGRSYQQYEEVSWLLFQGAGGVIDVNRNSTQIEPVLGKDDVRMVTPDDFHLLSELLDMNKKEEERLLEGGLYVFGKEIAALRSLVYSEV
jgi:hypothetical protein